MQNKSYISIFLLAFGFLWLFSSCEDCRFESVNRSYAIVAFERLNPNGQLVIVDTSFTRVYGFIPDLDETLPQGDIYNTESGRNRSFNLPLLTSLDTSVFVFEKLLEGDSIRLRDTLMLSYNVQRYILTPDCGVDEEITDLNVIFTTFDSVKIIHPTLNTFNEQDIRIRL
ncbi:MAG: hypothetical protein JJT94_10915 [Bernardetiaceae bacterium]|nr:hypothetical protein [Bernardetiaceae bacterium]